MALFQKFHSSNLAAIFSDFQIGGKCNNEKTKQANKQTIYLVSVTHPLIPQMTQMKLLVTGKGVKGCMEMCMYM